MLYNVKNIIQHYKEVFVCSRCIWLLSKNVIKRNLNDCTIHTIKLANSITELPNIPSESAKALIISMVKNKARNNLKAEHYDKVEPMDENQIPDTVMSDISFALRYKELIEMVNTLEQQYREVLVMRLVNGLSVNEISEKLDLPYRTVETRIFRARKKLKDRLKEMYDE